MQSLYGVDLGNGLTKGKSNYTEQAIAIPSIIGRLSNYSSLEIGSGEKLKNISVISQGSEYAVGDMALKNSTIRSHDITDDKYLSSSTELLVHTIISLTSEKIYSVGGIVLGIPIHKMNIAKEVQKMYEGKQFGVKLGYFGEYDTTIKQVAIQKALVVAQPHGTLFNLILDDKGKMENRDLAKSGIAIFDIGYKTNDGIVFSSLDPVGRLTINSKSGMHVAYEEIRSKIARRFNGLEVQTYEVPEIISMGKVKGNDVKDIINDSFYNLAVSIINEIKTKWEDAYLIDNLVFTGGGSTLLRPYLQQAFKNAIFPDNPQTSNAEGFLKYATRLWGDES